MKKQNMRIFAFFAVLLMVFSILPAGALAASDNAQKNDNGMSTGTSQSDSGADDSGNSADDSGDSTDDSDDNSDDSSEPAGVQQQDRDRDMVNAPDATRKMASNKIINKVKQVGEARDDYRSAKDNFANIKSKNPNLDTEEAIEATREYLISTIDYMVSVLDNEEYIAELEAERENVETATTRDEMADAAKEIRNIWQDARKDRVSSTGNAIDNKISNVIRTSESMMVRLENEIATKEANGEDVEALKAMLEEYKECIADAKENQERARNTYMNGNGNNGENIREANRYIVQSGKDIKDANAILRNMLKELKQEREGVVILSGEGTLEAEGNGTVVISGDVVIDLTVTDAKIVVKDLAGDGNVTMANDGYESSNVDAGNSTDNNRAFVYLNTTDEVHIEGSRLTVMIKGEYIKLEASGTGTAVLAGIGTYEAEGTSGEWASRYTDDSSDEEDEVTEEDEDDETIEAADATENENETES